MNREGPSDEDWESRIDELIRFPGLVFVFLDFAFTLFRSIVLNRIPSKSSQKRGHL